jgi:hypothetical protein
MAVVLNIASEFNNKGIRQATQQFKGLQDAGKRAGATLKSAVIPATAAVAALGAVLVSAVKGAMEDEVAQKELARVLKSTTKATDAQIAAVEDWITVQGQVLGITDDELRPAYAGLLRATKDVTKAQKLSAIAFDLAAAKGKPLAAVTKAIEQALGGNMVALAKLAPEYRDMIKNGASFEEVMKKVAEATGGAAAGAADTTAGKMKRLKIRFDELKETIGYALLPVLDELLTAIMDDVIPAFESLGSFIGDFGKQIKKDGFDKAVTDSFNKVVEYLKTEALPAIGNALSKVGKAFVDWIGPRFKPMVKALAKFIETAANWMLDTGLPTFIDKLKIWGQAFVDWIGPQIAPMLAALGKLIGDVAVWALTVALPKLLKLAAEWYAALIGWAFDLAPDIIKGLGEMVVAVIKKIPELASKLGGGFLDLGKMLGKNLANGIIGMINGVTGKINEILQFSIPVPVGPDIKVNPPDIPEIPKLAKGGIVNKPGGVLAMVGEKGPEAVIPLSKLAGMTGMGGMGGGINITVQTGVGDPVAIGKAVSDVLNAYNRRTGNAAA